MLVILVRKDFTEMSRNLSINIGLDNFFGGKNGETKLSKEVVSVFFVPLQLELLSNEHT